VDIGKPVITPLESVGQFGVVHPEQMQNGRVQIMDVDLALRGIKAEIVGLSIDDARLDAAARHPDSITVRMMVAAQLIWSQVTLHHGSAPELAAPDYQSRVQEPAFLQIVDQSDARLVGLQAALLQIVDKIAIRTAMMVPPAMIQLHERTPRSTNRRASKQLLANEARPGVVP